MRVPDWLPTSALVAMLVFMILYLGFFLTYWITDNSAWLIAAYGILLGYWVFTGFHIRHERRRKR